MSLYFGDGVKTEEIRLIDDEKLNDFAYAERLEALKECVAVLETIKAINNGEDPEDYATIGARIREKMED